MSLQEMQPHTLHATFKDCTDQEKPGGQQGPGEVCAPESLEEPCIGNEHKYIFIFLKKIYLFI